MNFKGEKSVAKKINNIFFGFLDFFVIFLDFFL